MITNAPSHTNLTVSRLGCQYAYMYRLANKLIHKQAVLDDEGLDRGREKGGGIYKYIMLGQSTPAYWDLLPISAQHHDNQRTGQPCSPVVHVKKIKRELLPS